MPKSKTSVPARPIEHQIHVLRGQKVMLDFELAALYGVETRALLQAVRRNPTRFPKDFMFQLSHAEAADMRSQSVITSKRGIKYQPLAFTEHGVAMLSSVLRSERAIHMNIMIVRTFVHVRELAASSKDIAARVEKLEHSHDRTSSVIEILVDDIDRLAVELNQMKAIPPSTKRKIGFFIDED